jgi:hypothetical protein
MAVLERTLLARKHTFDFGSKSYIFLDLNFIFITSNEAPRSPVNGISATLQQAICGVSKRNCAVALYPPSLYRASDFVQTPTGQVGAVHLAFLSGRS